MPHFLTLYEKSVPMVLVWVGAEDPVVSLRSRYRHRGFESAAIYTLASKKRNKICGLEKVRPLQRERADMVTFRHINLNVVLSMFYRNLSRIYKNIFPTNLYRVAIHPHRGILPDLAG